MLTNVPLTDWEVLRQVYQRDPGELRAWDCCIAIARSPFRSADLHCVVPPLRASVALYVLYSMPRCRCYVIELSRPSSVTCHFLGCHFQLSSRPTITTRIMSERSRSPSSPVFKDSDDEYDTKSLHSLSLDDSPKQRLAALSSLQDRVPVENPEPSRSPPIDTSATITASLVSNAPLSNEEEHGSESDGGFKDEPLSPPRSPSPKQREHDGPLSPGTLGTTVGESRAMETSSSLSSPQHTPVHGTKFVTPPPSAGVPLPVPVKDSDMSSISSETQRKLRPDSVLIDIPKNSLILGVAVVDFDHAVSGRYMCKVYANCKCGLGWSQNRIFQRVNILK